MCVFKLFFSFMICYNIFVLLSRQTKRETTNNNFDGEKDAKGIFFNNNNNNTSVGYILSYFICVCTRKCDCDASSSRPGVI